MKQGAVSSLKSRFWFLVALLYCVSGFFMHNKEAHATTSPSYLFTQSAREASIEKSQTQNNFYTLTLKQVNDHVTYFSERPARKTGVMSIEKFLRLWEQKGTQSFRKDPPNAELHLTYIGPDKVEKTQEFAVELTDPNYNKMAGSLSYQIKLLTGNTISFPQQGHYKNVTLFIDDACLTCW